jgi:hypothetical protein
LKTFGIDICTDYIPESLHLLLFCAMLYGLGSFG